MRVVVVGASGNVGTSLLARLGDDPEVESVLGLARRRPRLEVPKTDWAEADVASSDLVPHFRGADCVVHLAWLIQPARDRRRLWRANVDGSVRVFRAVADAGVPALVYASSVGVYSPGPKDRPVDESWPRDGIRSNLYSRGKAEVERRLDAFEREHPSVRVVRLRPGLIFKREAASGIRRLFAGPFLPSPLLRPELLPFFPEVPGLRFQAVHSLDVGEAYRLAVRSDAHGAFNVAAEPVLDSGVLARELDARPVPMSSRVLRGLVAVSWRLHLQPTPPSWIDLALGVPLLDSSRARRELGWEPRRSAVEAFHAPVRQERPLQPRQQPDPSLRARLRPRDGRGKREDRNPNRPGHRKRRPQALRSRRRPAWRSSRPQGRRKGSWRRPRRRSSGRRRRRCRGRARRRDRTEHERSGHPLCRASRLRLLQGHASVGPVPQPESRSLVQSTVDSRRDAAGFPDYRHRRAARYAPERLLQHGAGRNEWLLQLFRGPAAVIRIRRVETSLPFLRKYELELSSSGRGPQPTERVIARRGAAVRQLERIIGVGDAWSFINEADRQWAAGNRSWAVEFEAAP